MKTKSSKFQNISLQNKSGHFFQDGLGCTDKENAKTY